MSYEDIKAIISKQMGIEPEDVKLSSKFQEDLGIDSLDIFEIITEIEEQYSVEIPTEDLEGMVVVADLVDYLKEWTAN